MANNDQSRTEAPTQRRREEARDEGRIAKSGDLSLGLVLLAGSGYFWLAGGKMGQSLMTLLRNEISLLSRQELTATEASRMLIRMALDVARVCAPLLVAVAVTGMLVGVLQAGVKFSGKALEPNWEKLSPAKGWSNLFSQKSAMRGVMAVAKLLAIGALVAWTLSGRLGGIAASGQDSLIGAVSVAWDLAVHVMLVVSTGLLVVGVTDYFYQRIRHEEELKMTRQELTEEHKRDEGDPQIRARLKKLRREYVQKQMLRDVPRATVVLTNPEHFAVALRYDRATMAAPIVVAKGADLLAQRIAKIARENGVPVLQRKPLARALFASASVGQEIPESLYRAIAEVLAYVYGLTPGR